MDPSYRTEHVTVNLERSIPKLDSSILYSRSDAMFNLVSIFDPHLARSMSCPRAQRRMNNPKGHLVFDNMHKAHGIWPHGKVQSLIGLMIRNECVRITSGPFFHASSQVPIAAATLARIQLVSEDFFFSLENDTLEL